MSLTNSFVNTFLGSLSTAQVAMSLKDQNRINWHLQMGDNYNFLITLVVQNSINVLAYVGDSTASKSMLYHLNLIPYLLDKTD